MKINFDTVLASISGENLKDQDGNELSLKTVAEEALLSHYPKEDIDGHEKVKRFRLARRIEEGGEVELDVDGIKKIKDLIGVRWPPLIVGRSWEILDPVDGKEKDGP